jgi:predicted nucleotidyltransferase
MNIENSKISQIQELCKLNKVKTLFVFGSAIRNDFNKNSDIDLIVDIEENDPFTYTDLYFNLKTKLEEILKRKVDLLEERAIKNRFFKQELDNSKVLIYGH